MHISYNEWVLLIHLLPPFCVMKYKEVNWSKVGIWAKNFVLVFKVYFYLQYMGQVGFGVSNSASIYRKAIVGSYQL